MKKGYNVGFYGNDPKVINGTWRELFDDDAEGPMEGKSFEDAMRHGVGSEDKIREGPEVEMSTMEFLLRIRVEPRRKEDKVMAG